MTSPLLNRIAAEHAAAPSPASQGDGHRQRALTALLERGLPTSRDENWRYANLRALEKAHFTPAPTGTAVTAALPPPIEGFARFVFVDGQFAASLSAAQGAVPGVTLGRIHGAMADNDEAFVLLNEAFATDGADLAVSADVVRADVELLFYGASPAAAYPRLRVHLTRNARLRLIERHIGSQRSAQFVNCVARVELDEGAACDHYRLQETGAATTWNDTLHARVSRNAAYQLHLLQVGALAARTTAHVELAGPAAQTRIDAVCLADGHQVHDTMITVDHQAPHTRTVENFRGIAAGRARIAFNGMIIVRDTAHNADSAQSLKGLIAGAEAEIDLRPQLEIHTDEVRCSHGATTGKLDEVMLFYLLTRGIEPQVAQRLLKWAFITDVVARIDIAELRAHVERSLAAHMQDARSLEELLS